MSDEDRMNLLYSLSLTARADGEDSGRKEDMEELVEKKERFEYLHAMMKRLHMFARSAVSLSEQIQTQEKSFELFGDRKKLAKRNDVLITKNPHVQFVDQHTHILWEQYAGIRALGAAAQQFITDSESTLQQIAQVEDRAEAMRGAIGKDQDGELRSLFVAKMIDSAHLLQDLENQVQGFLSVCDLVRKFKKAFLASSREIQKGVQKYFKDMEWLYGYQDEYDPDKLQEENMWRIYRGEEIRPPKIAVPLKNQNVRYTGLLHEAVRQIPVVEDAPPEGEKEQSGKKRKAVGDEGPKKETATRMYDQLRIREFAEYLRSIADKNTLASVRNNEYFTHLANMMLSSHSALAFLSNAYDRAKIEEQKENDPSEQREKYGKKVATIKKRILPDATEKDFETFDLQPLLKYLHAVDFNVIQTPPEATDQEKETIRRNTAYAKMFDMLDERLSVLATPVMDADTPEDHPASDESMRLFIEQLIEIKHDLPHAVEKKKKKRKDKERMRKDKEKGNVAFTPHVGIMDLQLTQIPTGNDRFEDLHGRSWEVVREAIQDVFAYSKTPHLFEVGSPTERFKQHLLIFGPPGCGKTKFGRAFTNYDAIVSVLMSTSRIGSPYIHEAEANVGRLWEATYEQSREFDKPAGIFWDEFDTVTEAEEGTRGGSIKAMRKAVQMVLDGDIHYDGVSLIAFSNEPEAIPPEIYQRFGGSNVHLVKPLSPDERIDLMRHWLKGIPTHESFKTEANWREFTQLSNHTAGRILGDVAQKCHRLFLERFRTKYPRHAETANKTFEEWKQDGVRVTPEMKREVYEKRGGAKGIALHGEEFNMVVKHELTSSVVQAAQIAQEKFYADFDKMMQRAHGHKFD